MNCPICSESLGDIFICGEGFVCIPCFSKYSGMEESDAFFENNITGKAKSTFRANLQEEKSSSTSSR